jgi:hypothetical protein
MDLELNGVFDHWAAEDDWMEEVDAVLSAD